MKCSIMSIVPNRYAEGLMKIAVEHRLVDEFEEELDYMLQNIFTKDFLDMLIYPAVSTAKKKEFAKKLLDGKVNDYLVRFIILLIQNERISLVDCIIDEYKSLADKFRNSETVEIISAFKLSEEQIDAIKNKVLKMYGYSNLKVVVNIDASVIGGVKIKIGNTVIDNTIKRKFEVMQDTLI